MPWPIPGASRDARCSRPALQATRAGLLDLQWDLLCPMCRGPQVSAGSLREINPNVHCAGCQIDFTVSFDRFVEITFRPNASVRVIASGNILPRQSATYSARRRATTAARPRVIAL